MIEEVAAADASVAWHLMVAAGAQVITARLPLASLQEYYANGPDIWAKGAAAPRGIAVPVQGGYRLSGRWPLASGARNFDWISLGFFVMDGDGPRRAPGRHAGPADLPRPARRREGDRDVGRGRLRGTRSDDLEVADLFVPEAWQASMFGPSSIDSAILGISMPVATAPHHSAVVTGILKASLRHLAADSLGRKPAFNPTVLMKDDPVFRSRFGEIASRVDAVCGLAEMCVRLLETCNRERRDVTRAKPRGSDRRSR